MNQTNQNLIFAVIGAAIVMALSFVGALEYLVISGVQDVNEKIFAAFLATGSSVLSFMFGVLVNTRTAPPSTTTETTITTKPEPPPIQTTPTQVEVVNKPSDPVPTEETKTIGEWNAPK